MGGRGFYGALLQAPDVVIVHASQELGMVPDPLAPEEAAFHFADEAS